jgi:hypothetical protein
MKWQEIAAWEKIFTTEALRTPREEGDKERGD